MSAKHTPGPWHYHKCPCGMNGCHQYTISVQWSKGFVEADARLIAAAPDLLAALRNYAKESFDGYGQPNGAVARAAIAKAEGRTE